MQHPVVTLTLNPALDGACEADAVIPTHKIRTRNQRYDPGGGGINAARVLAELGQDVCAAFLSGGASGAMLQDLLRERQLPFHPLPIAGETRRSLAVYETASGQEYRFVPEGPLVSAPEWQGVLAMAEAMDDGWLIASGSLPRGVPEDFYGRLAAICGRKGTALVLDTSGPALAAALEAGGLALIKPSQSEFEDLTGQTFSDEASLGEAACALAAQGKAQHIAVTRGAKGAVLAHGGGWIALPSPEVETRSATGAGDSFIAGMVHGLMSESDLTAAFRWGLAAGAATAMTPGTELCHRKDVERLVKQLAQSDIPKHHC
ncbi:1-phosphofructokinase family hexose kinase [Altericroceibacterium spongiae]|uniref:Phosphofructokinase n=1 Tax=Altericroceibacterium spongiae TaxID=2320269 RepID=A0A420EBW8_9SPHN|nr:1-phosphofructokinase family hexose kinase [Altericroceibacterium spongiae]RKF18190.1 1-phosphofructokinase family hexose kinase [Altericroceibacterium spongiae]